MPIAIPTRFKIFFNDIFFTCLSTLQFEDNKTKCILNNGSFCCFLPGGSFRNTIPIRFGSAEVSETLFPSGLAQLFFARREFPKHYSHRVWPGGSFRNAIPIRFGSAEVPETLFPSGLARRKFPKRYSQSGLARRKFPLEQKTTLAA